MKSARNILSQYHYATDDYERELVVSTVAEALDRAKGKIARLTAYAIAANNRAEDLKKALKKETERAESLLNAYSWAVIQQVKLSRNVFCNTHQKTEKLP